jgi:dipeptidyl aminopeptidase/acylaminoacyl peptidase
MVSRKSNLIAAAVALLAVTLPATCIAARSYWFERQNFVPAPPSPLLNRPEATGIPGLVAVSFPRRDRARLFGWFVAPRNRATIVLLHGTNADRSSLLWEAQVLAQHQFGVLVFDWPGYGMSDGEIRWGPGEQDALVGALDWLIADRKVDRDRIGALGFSNGGYILAQVAAIDTRLRAIVLAATPSDIIDQTRWEHRKYGPFSQIPAVWALQWSGMPVQSRSPLIGVGSIAPRPILIIGGSADTTVPPSMERALYRAAGQPKQLWIVPGAHHGQYARVAADEYGRRLVEFFSSALLY